MEWQTNFEKTKTEVVLKQHDTTREDLLLHEAFVELYPSKDIPQLTLKYSGRFSSYNGNVNIKKILGKIVGLEFSISKKYINTEKEITTGIIQELMNKVYKTRVNTLNQDLYQSFIKHLTNYTPLTESHELLNELFNEINDEYFSGTMPKPNMVFGKASYRTLGHYTYTKDLVTISSLLKPARELLRYVLYHELLHKKHKFRKSLTGRNMHHTKEFRDEEKLYADKNIEKKLVKFVTNERRILGKKKRFGYLRIG